MKKMLHHKDNRNKKNDFRARSVSEVLGEWHHSHYIKMTEAKEVILRGMWPPINKMDKSLALLQACVILSLSKNMIEKISNLQGLTNLKVLSLAQNNIKSLKGLESVRETLEVLIIAKNFIKETKGILCLSKLKELDISYNDINDPREFIRLTLCKNLIDLTFKENPLAKRFPPDIWRMEALKVFTGLDLFDYMTVEEDERYYGITFSEIFKLKGDMIIHSPKYMEYNSIFQEAMNEMLETEQTSEENYIL